MVIGYGLSDLESLLITIDVILDDVQRLVVAFPILWSRVIVLFQRPTLVDVQMECATDWTFLHFVFLGLAVSTFIGASLLLVALTFLCWFVSVSLLLQIPKSFC